LDTGVAYRKQLIGPKLLGFGLGQHPKYLELPTYFYSNWC